MPTKKAKRSDNRYEVAITLGRDESGKRIRKSFYGATQAEARAKRDAFLQGLEEKPLRKGMTLSRWIEVYMRSYATGGYRNKLNNASILNVFCKGVGDRLLEEVKPADIQAYAQTQGEYTKSHVDKVRRAITKLF